MLGGLIRPGISFGRSDIRKLARVQFEPDWLDRLAFGMIALGLVIIVGLVIVAVGAVGLALLFR
jgi:hypothetical protein